MSDVSTLTNLIQSKAGAKKTAKLRTPHFTCRSLNVEQSQKVSCVWLLFLKIDLPLLGFFSLSRIGAKTKGSPKPHSLPPPPRVNVDRKTTWAWIRLKGFDHIYCSLSNWQKMSCHHFVSVWKLVIMI